MSVALLPRTLDGATVALEVAWGADLADIDGSGWSWTDITTDVRYSSGISYKLGANDETSLCQPGQLTVTLDNTEGDYSVGGQAANWPYIRQGTPVRVRITLDGVASTVFLGYADEWAPDWSDDGNDATVTLTASGALRRLQQNGAAVLSPMRRLLSTDTGGVVAYWPCEEGVDGDELVLSAFPDDPPMKVVSSSGDIDFASNAKFPCSLPLPTIGLATALVAPVPAYAATGEATIRWLLSWPDSQPTTDTLIRVITDSPSFYWIDLNYASAAGSLQLLAYNSSMTQVYDSGVVGFAVNGKDVRMYIDLAQDGSDVDVEFGLCQLGSTSVLADTGTCSSVTMGRILKVEVNPDGALDDFGFGHLVVYDNDVADFDVDELNSFTGETVTGTGRLFRLASENDLSVTITGTSETIGHTTDKCGPQQIDDLVPLLRDAEAVDRGFLFDGFTAGLNYYTRRLLENINPTVTLDAADLAPGWSVTTDDFGRLNRAAVTREGGSTATYEDTDGALGTAVVGVYDGAETVNYWRDDAPFYLAGWKVAQGTAEGYRLPQLVLNMGALDPDTVSDVVLLSPWERVDITGLSDVRAQLPRGTLSLRAVGISHRITPRQWTVTLNCAPDEPRRAVKLADATADTSEYLLHLDTEDSELASAANKNAPTLSVATNSGPLWTTTADDCPFDIEVGGIRVTVTAISGASSPQTFTVTSSHVTKALPSGSPVRVWRVPGLGL